MGPLPRMTWWDMTCSWREGESGALGMEQCSQSIRAMSRAPLSLANTARAEQTRPVENRPDAPRGARERARAEVMSELLASARERLGTDGAANLSLRAVARDLGVSSSAVYRYVESRDALLTLLIVEAYDAVGQVAEGAAARARAAGSPPAETWLAVARGVRGWALANRHSFEPVSY